MSEAATGYSGRRTRQEVDVPGKGGISKCYWCVGREGKWRVWLGGGSGGCGWEGGGDVVAVSLPTARVIKAVNCDWYTGTKQKILNSCSFSFRRSRIS